MLMPNELRSLSEPSLAPFISGFVTSTWRDTSWLSIEFQSMSFLFQSTFSRLPKIVLMRSTSFFPEITSTCSSSSIIVSDVGIMTLPPFHTLDMTNCTSAFSRISFMLFPNMAGLFTLYSTTKVLSPEGSYGFCVVFVADAARSITTHNMTPTRPAG